MCPGYFPRLMNFTKVFLKYMLHCTLLMSTACVRFDMLFDPVFVATILLGVYFQMFSWPRICGYYLCICRHYRTMRKLSNFQIWPRICGHYLCICRHYRTMRKLSNLTSYLWPLSWKPLKQACHKPNVFCLNNGAVKSNDQFQWWLEN